MKDLWIDLVLWLIASPILFVRALYRLWGRWKFWRMAYTLRIVCRNCRGTIWLVGQWRCACGFEYRGHLLRACSVCGALPRMVRCYACGVTTKLPEP